MNHTGEVEASSSNRLKFIIGGLLIVTAVIYFIVSSTIANAQYFMTVDEMAIKGDSVKGRNVRISGAVVGNSIEYDPQTMNLTFTIAHVPEDNKEIEKAGGLAMVLHRAVMTPGNNRLKVVYNGVVPDLLQNEAQAIITGKLGEDDIFYAEELLLKCPTKYEEAIPDQAEGSLP
jgi:cytochrome c-type biogenesis protein CcmE